MDNLIVLAIAASIVYFFARFIEMRFINKESEPLKGLFKDSVFVMIATGLGGFIVSQIGDTITSGNVLSGGGESSTPAFTGNPEF